MKLSGSGDGTEKTADKAQLVDDVPVVSAALVTTTANSDAAGVDLQRNQQKPEAGCCCFDAGFVYTFFVSCRFAVTFVAFCL